MRALVRWVGCVGFLVATVGIAAPEDPDREFGSAGILSLGVSTSAYSFTSVPHAWDGQIVVAEDHLVLRRYTDDGRPDPTFGTNGVARAPEYCPPASPDKCWIAGVGKHLGGGYAVVSTGASDYRYWVAWLDRAGRREAWYGYDALVPVELVMVAGLGVADDGTVTLAGGDGKGEFTQLRRIAPGGQVQMARDLFHEYLNDFVVMPDRRMLLLYVGGRVERLLPDGTPDPRFGIRGGWNPGAGSGLIPVSLTLLLDGGVMVTGSSGEGEEQQAAVVVLSADGAPNTAIAPGGRLSLRAASFGPTQGIVAQIDDQGRTLLLARSAIPCATSGQCDCPDNLCNWRIVVGRFGPGGAPDTTLGANGWVVVPYPAPLLGYDLAVNSSGRFLVWAHRQQDIRCYPVTPHLCEDRPVVQDLLIGLLGGQSTTPRAWPEDAVFEYIHRSSGQYFLAASAREQASITVDDTSPWRVTGQSFKAWPRRSPHPSRSAGSGAARAMPPRRRTSIRHTRASATRSGMARSGGTREPSSSCNFPRVNPVHGTSPAIPNRSIAPTTTA